MKFPLLQAQDTAYQLVLEIWWQSFVELTPEGHFCTKAYLHVHKTRSHFQNFRCQDLLILVSHAQRINEIFKILL